MSKSSLLASFQRPGEPGATLSSKISLVEEPLQSSLVRPSADYGSLNVTLTFTSSTTKGWVSASGGVKLNCNSLDCPEQLISEVTSKSSSLTKHLLTAIRRLTDTTSHDTCSSDDATSGF